MIFLGFPFFKNSLTRKKREKTEILLEILWLRAGQQYYKPSEIEKKGIVSRGN